MRICYVSDGKAGHVAQAHGLFFALKQQCDHAELIELPVQSVSMLALVTYWLSGGRLGQLPAVLAQQPAIDVFVVVGHRTHWTGLLLRRIFCHSRLLVLMKPSLPLRWFDYAVIPAHDLVQAANQPLAQDRVLISQGVLNPIVNQHQHQAKRGLILVGGASKRHGWSQAQLLAQIEQVVAAHPDDQLILTTSRRTPTDFLSDDFFDHLPKRVTVFPVQQTPKGWLFEQLQLASQVWVTEDSVSMLYEALTAGCQVHILKMPRLKEDRITRSVDLLAEQAMVSFDLVQNTQLDQKPPVTLNEAERVAHWLLQQRQENHCR